MDKYEISFDQLDLSYRKISSILLPLICNSLSLSSLIKNIHFDGGNSSCYSVIHEFLFYNSVKQSLLYPNLEALIITRCSLSQSLLQILSVLVQKQLNQLTLTFDEEIFESIRINQKNQ
ncbi:unnamed protein product [Rotaria socialis]|uniref:Uncharacterized protein n=1 Tax=Rotaria socialis TaxID=392032 RepID=A0A821SMA3_9BILA|nr:unnamed protein product [Rotaria socialis]CAF3428725.1 unnamed protein product [Rotaria socialis]CAF4438529.1 unnamed protein product [Rotaria socialis]CAF4862136.1 unnamed protein product [Rotaria socialis]